jgi:hypothetical protein
MVLEGHIPYRFPSPSPGVSKPARTCVSLHYTVLMTKYRAVSDETQKVGLSVLPFFHIYGFNSILNATLYQGMHMVSLSKFTPEDYVSCVLKFKVMVKQVITLFSCTNRCPYGEHQRNSKLYCFLLYDMIYLLTAIGLSPGGSSTVHIYTQTVHRTIQNNQYIEQHNNFGRVQAVPRLG